MVSFACRSLPLKELGIQEDGELSFERFSALTRTWLKASKSELPDALLTACWERLNPEGSPAGQKTSIRFSCNVLD